MSALSPPPGGLPSPGLPPDHVGLGCLGMAPSPPTMYHLGEGRGLGTQAALPPLPLGAGPLRQRAARACPRVTLRGGRGQEQGAHSAATSGQPTGRPGVGGGEQTGKGRETRGGRSRDRDRERDRDTETPRGRRPVTLRRAARPPPPGCSPQSCSSIQLNLASHASTDVLWAPSGAPGTFWGGH